MLGMVVQELGRMAEAEGHYRQASEIYLAFDDSRRAAATYLALGELMTALDRPVDAVVAYLNATVAWYQATQVWPANGIEPIRRLRAQHAWPDFDDIVETAVPAELVDALQEELNRVEDQ
jgi:hypothetical protein